MNRVWDFPHKYICILYYFLKGMRQCSETAHVWSCQYMKTCNMTMLVTAWELTCKYMLSWLHVRTWKQTATSKPKIPCSEWWRGLTTACRWAFSKMGRELTAVESQYTSSWAIGTSVKATESGQPIQTEWWGQPWSTPSTSAWMVSILEGPTGCQGRGLRDRSERKTLFSQLTSFWESQQWKSEQTGNVMKWAGRPGLRPHISPPIFFL